MTFPIGVNPPLHRRFSEQKALEGIRLRYVRIRKYIPSQIARLQADSEFRKFCRRFYEKGYKDWTILVGIINCMIQWNDDRLDIDRWTKPNFVSIEEEGSRLQDTIFPAWRFMEKDLEVQVQIHGIITLRGYGFEPRRPDFDPKAVDRFLRLRMKHFEFDLPHSPMFGEPPGDWPDV